MPVLARAAVASGCYALFMKVHNYPDQAPCDGFNMIALGDSLVKRGIGTVIFKRCYRPGGSAVNHETSSDRFRDVHENFNSGGSSG